MWKFSTKEQSVKEVDLWGNNYVPDLNRPFDARGLSFPCVYCANTMVLFRWRTRYWLILGNILA